MLLLILTAHAQEFSSDHPGYGNSTGMIPAHHSQVEGGLTFNPPLRDRGSLSPAPVVGPPMTGM